MDKHLYDAIDDEVLYLSADTKQIVSHQRRLLDYFKGAPGRILEIGCGRGVTLGLLKEAGLEAYGLDLSETAVEECRKKGLNAVVGDAISHLQSVAADSLGGVFCAHVIEHLPPLQAMEMLTHLHRVTKGGAAVVFITPNAKDLRTTERFWMDITHVRPYPRKLLEFMLKRHGFSQIRSFTNPEPAKNIVERIAKQFLRLWFMGYLFTGDLVVVARK